MNLNFALVSEAAAVLGTEQTTETVHAAMRDVVARASGSAPRGSRPPRSDAGGRGGDAQAASRAVSRAGLGA